MQVQALIIALAAASLARAQDINSIVSVLETAIPSSVIQQAQTDFPGFVSSVESEAAAGQTPSWFENLPADVKSYFGLDVTGTMTGDVAEGTGDSSSSMGDSTQSSVSDMTMATESTMSMFTSMSTGDSTGASSSSNGGSAAAASTTSGSSTGGAAAPTQIVGMGIAGAMGLVGLMVL